MRRLLVLAAALSIAVACAHKKKAPSAAPLPVVQPTIAFEGVKVEGLKFTGANLLFRARIENANPFPLSVTRIEYALQLEGRPAAAGAMDSALVVPAPTPAPPAPPPAPGVAPPPPAPPAPGVAEIALPVAVRFSAVPGCAKVLAAEKEASYVLGGSVAFMTPAGPIGVPLSQSGTFVVPKLPKIHVQRAALKSASAREVTVEVQLAITNPNEFPIPPGHVGYGLFVADREVVRADLDIAAPIDGGETASFGAPVKISVLKAGRAAARLLIPFKSMDIKLKGEAVFEGVPVPLDLGTSMTGNQQ